MSFRWLVAFFMLVVCAPTFAWDDYSESFDNWPNSTWNSGCAGNSPPANCNGSSLDGENSQSTGKVRSAPGGQACRGGSGKCYYDNVQQEAHETNILIKGGAPASTTSQYLRFYIRYGQTFGNGNHKLFRMGNPDSLTLVMWHYGLLLEPDDTCIIDGSDGFNPNNYTGQWLKIESWLSRNGSSYTARLWVTTENGTEFTQGCSFNDPTDMTEIKLTKNRSGSPQGDFWLDDICGGKQQGDRTGFCADGNRPNPPAGLVVQ